MLEHDLLARTLRLTQALDQPDGRSASQFIGRLEHSGDRDNFGHSPLDFVKAHQGDILRDALAARIDGPQSSYCEAIIRGKDGINGRIKFQKLASQVKTD